MSRMIVIYLKGNLHEIIPSRLVEMFVFALLLVISPALCQLGGITKAIKDGGEQAISAVATPVEKAVVGATLKNCDVFKTLFGITYDAISEPDTSKLTLDLWSGDKKETINITNADDALLNNKNFDTKKPTIIFLHGFMSSSESDASLSVTRSFVRKGGYNVLALDSSSLIKYFYLKSSTVVHFVGEELGRVLAGLVTKGGVDPKSIHIIGHSLGSHIAGTAGKTFQTLTGKNIKRITGLDPAGPCFFRETLEFRLTHHDADFVDAIHSDSGILGITDPIGHVDFYPNGGEAQPGCAIPPCSHSRSWQLFNESIQDPHAFPAQKCPGWDTFKSDNCKNNPINYMGLPADNKRGVYYLKTNGDFPYKLNRPKESSGNLFKFL